MERTSPKRIRIDAAVFEAQKVNAQLILAEGLAQRAQVSVKEEKIESRKLAQVSVKEAADREKIEMLAATERAEVSVKEAADREKIEMLAAADRNRAEKTDSKRAEKIGRKTDRCTEHEAARVKINDEEAQTKRIKIDAEEGEKSCGAEGCGKRNNGQFTSRSRDAMRQHCATLKHKVFNSAKCPFLLMFTTA